MGVFIKRINLDTDPCSGRLSHEDEGRNQGDASTSQGSTEDGQQHQQLGRNLSRVSFPAGPTPGSQTSGLQVCKNKFLLL